MKLSTLTSVSANVDDEEELHHKKTPKSKNKSGPKFVKFWKEIKNIKKLMQHLVLIIDTALRPFIETLYCR